MKYLKKKTKFPLIIIDLFGDFELRYDVVLFMCVKGKSLLVNRKKNHFNIFFRGRE